MTTSNNTLVTALSGLQLAAEGIVASELKLSKGEVIDLILDQVTEQLKAAVEVAQAEKDTLLLIEQKARQKYYDKQRKALLKSNPLVRKFIKAYGALVGKSDAMLPCDWRQGLPYMCDGCTIILLDPTPTTLSKDQVTELEKSAKKSLGLDICWNEHNPHKGKDKIVEYMHLTLNVNSDYINVGATRNFRYTDEGYALYTAYVEAWNTWCELSYALHEIQQSSSKAKLLILKSLLAETKEGKAFLEALNQRTGTALVKSLMTKGNK